jgi:hypothetical protein
MPVHPHHCAEGLKPEWMGETAQEFIAAEVVNNRFAYDRAQARHTVASQLGTRPP